MTETKKPIDTSWKAVILGEGNGFYVMFFIVVAVLLVWVESAAIITWWWTWWWAVVLVLAAIIALVVLVVKRLTTPKFAPVPEPLLDKPWTTTNPFARPIPTPTTTTKRPSINQFGGYQGLGGRIRPSPSVWDSRGFSESSTYSKPSRSTDVDEPEDKPRPVAGQAVFGSAPKPKPSVSAYRGLSKPKPAYQGMNFSK
ncbi:MAG: hypothetical protein JRN35_07855, partial [Nitrososphaerota archaeon]|nr:hypothetical protein [Nitrososphaerota archaeon]